MSRLLAAAQPSGAVAVPWFLLPVAEPHNCYIEVLGSEIKSYIPRKEGNFVGNMFETRKTFIEICSLHESLPCNFMELFYCPNILQGIK